MDDFISAAVNVTATVKLLLKLSPRLQRVSVQVARHALGMFLESYLQGMTVASTIYDEERGLTKFEFVRSIDD
jgi:hypothetical protein